MNYRRRIPPNPLDSAEGNLKWSAEDFNRLQKKISVGSTVSGGGIKLSAERSLNYDGFMYNKIIVIKWYDESENLMLGIASPVCQI